MNKRSRPDVRTDIATGRLLHRGRKEKVVKIGAIGEPGRYSVVGKGMRRGIKHFSES